MKGPYRLARLAALVVGPIWAFSQGASAATVWITDQVFTGNAPSEGTPTPTSLSGSFSRSVTGGDTPSPSGLGSGGRLSPYAFNTGPGSDGSAAATDAPYSVLGAGGASPIGSATYNVNSSSFGLLWGSPDPYNQVAFFSGLNGMGSNLGEFNSTNLACFSTSCNETGFDLATFTDPSGDIGSVVLSNSTAAAFEYGIDPLSTPLPGTIYLFGSVLVGAFWLNSKKHRAVSGLGSA